MSKPPPIGALVEHDLPHIPASRQGVVEYHLGSGDQFCYRTDDGQTFICSTGGEPWRTIAAAAKKAPAPCPCKPCPFHKPFTPGGEAMRVYRVDTGDKTLWCGTQADAVALLRDHEDAVMNTVDVPYKKSELIEFLNHLYQEAENDASV